MLFAFISCKPMNKQQKEILSILDEWIGKTILMPNSYKLYPYIQNYNFDSLYYNADFKILNYIDSLECISCNLRLKDWNILMKSFSENRSKEVTALFVFSPKNIIRMKEVIPLVKRNAMTFPIIIDSLDSFNSLNRFPNNSRFHTFLLDKNNQILAVGNPVANARIKELYLDIINGRDTHSASETLPMTDISISTTCLDLGTFAWNKKKGMSFSINNIGQKPLVISEIIASCGCMEIIYDKTPVQPNKTVRINVYYQAESPGYFNKTIKIYSNSNTAPLILKVRGNAI